MAAQKPLKPARGRAQASHHHPKTRTHPRKRKKRRIKHKGALGAKMKIKYILILARGDIKGV